MNDMVLLVDGSEVQNRSAVFFSFADFDIYLKGTASWIFVVEDRLEPFLDSVGVRPSELGEEFFLCVIFDIGQIDFVKTIITLSDVIISIDTDIEIIAFNLFHCFFVKMAIGKDKTSDAKKHKENNQ